jgi:hypothetical protein
MSFYEVGSTFSPSTICLVTLRTVLHDLGFDDFNREMTEKIVQYGFPFNFEEVQECEQLVSRLITEHLTPTQNEGEKWNEIYQF